MKGYYHYSNSTFNNSTIMMRLAFDKNLYLVIPNQLNIRLTAYVLICILYDYRITAELPLMLFVISNF